MARNYLAVIPARGGSKRIPRKNLAMFAGKPLIAHTIEAALKSHQLTRVIVSTDDPEIVKVAREYNAEVPFLRPAKLAGDQCSSLAVLLHALDMLNTESFQVDAVVLLQPTSPLRTSQHIDEAITLFEKSGADTVTAVCAAAKHPFYAWTLSGDELSPFFTMDRQTIPGHELPPAFFENGSIYIIDRAVLDSGQFYGRRIIPYYMDDCDSVDIDTPIDLLWAEFLLARKHQPTERINDAEDISSYRNQG